MAQAYDNTEVFCTEDEVETFGGWDTGHFSPTTKPSESQVYQFCKTITAQIVAATERWGLRIVPPNTNAPNDFVKEQLIGACGTGTAMLARNAIALRTGEPRDETAWIDLTHKFAAAMFKGVSSTAIEGSEDLSLQGAIEASQNVGVVDSWAVSTNTFSTDQDGRTGIDIEHLITDAD